MFGHRAVAEPPAKVSKRLTPFQKTDEVEYGLEIVSRDANHRVDCVQCLFCRVKGREASHTGAKRQRTHNIKLFKSPFRKDNYRSHLQSQHPSEWAEYQKLGIEAKKAFFAHRSEDRHTLRDYFNTPQASLVFDVKASIVDELIFGIFWSEDEEAIPIARTRDQFVLLESGDYRVTVANPLRFQLAIDHIGVGLSFRQAASVIQQHQQATKNPKLMGMTDGMVSNHARLLVAVAMQRIGDILREADVWAFSFACDCSTHMGISFMDQRLRLPVGGVLVNLHLVAIPMFDRHTAVNQVRLIQIVLDAIAPHWRDKLIGISSDGENTMTGCRGGVVTLLEREATYPVLRVWCPPHQIDLVVKSAFANLCEGKFVQSTIGFIKHLRRQETLITEMGTTCPKLTNRWVHMGSSLAWIVRHRIRIQRHLEEKEVAEAPGPRWWLTAAVGGAVASAINITFVRLQSPLLTISQQRAEIRILVDELQRMVSATDLPDDMEMVGPHDFTSARWWIYEESLVGLVDDQGSFFRDQLKDLPAAERQTTVGDLARFMLHLLEGLGGVQAERDSFNRPTASPAPPVMPLELVQLKPRDFVLLILDPLRSRLLHFWSEEQVEQVENDHRQLCMEYAKNDRLTECIDGQTRLSMFNDSWDAVQRITQNGMFHQLRQLCCGLASVFANTTSVEADFSVLKWEKDDRRTALTSLALEGVFQAKQFKLLSSL